MSNLVKKALVEKLAELRQLVDQLPDGDIDVSNDIQVAKDSDS